MRRNREELQDKITFAIKDIHRMGDAEKIKKLASTKLNKYFSEAKILQILNDSIPLASLTEEELYNVSLFVKDSGYTNVDLQEFFDNDEASRAVNTFRTADYNYDKEVVFGNMQYNGDELKPQWVGFISYQDIAKMFEAGVFNYNFATQRKAKMIKVRNRVERIATINNKNVQEIKNEVLRNKFEYNTITLNIRPSENDSYLYNPSTLELMVDLVATCIDTIDGYHRINGIYQAWLKNNNISGSMILLIKNIDIPQARYFIAQESKGTLNNQSEMKIYDMDTNIAKLITGINQDYTNVLGGRISTGNNTNNPLVYYEIFRHIMELSWGEKLNTVSPIELINIKDYISNFYTVTYELIMKKFKVNNIDEIDDNLSIDMMFLSGWLFPALKIYEENDGKIDLEKIKKIISKIDWSAEDSKFTYENSNDSYEVDTYVKAWSRII